MNDEYLKAVHAMQSGVAMMLGKWGADGAGANPKHLRVGVNVAIVESSALWKLLVDKGVISREEMETRLVEAHRQEVERYRHEIAERMGIDPDKIELA